MVRWMWLGAILMGLGGFTTALDKRYRRARNPATAQVAGEALHGA
jgi:cytochrome c-type biogenesis protein CcmF